MRTIDRFHIQKLANDVLQEMRIATMELPLSPNMATVR